jgi:hypothetical protein
MWKRKVPTSLTAKTIGAGERPSHSLPPSYDPVFFSKARAPTKVINEQSTLVMRSALGVAAATLTPNQHSNNETDIK